ncbi:hypothetical protein EGR_07768 [Echinococcus granulosus]|uniref:Uncharacterized protein n=1 Tax=Echinococcus granulosus TaxID=6210 RepID=W6U887_ECHGR|nr:hypothetical protein EGR_07768 [Echinococcus granulosus]EUB57375.1 hypothetical protein EGR_07768 [Echinococcus granulosus]
MLTNISNKLATTFARPPKSSTKSPTHPATSAPLAEWPSNVTVPGEPLFTRHLTSADLDALEEAAGLGPPSWWLDAELAWSDSSLVGKDVLSYEEEVALTAMLRAPFEQAGPIRSAASGLLDRLNELERLQALALEEGRRRAQGKEKRVRHHSTLRLAAKSIDVEEEEKTVIERKGDVDGHYRRDTYAVNKHKPVYSTPMKSHQRQEQDTLNPRICKSPERRETNRSEGCELQRTYSKNSLNRLHVEGELQRSLNANIAASDLSGNSTQLLGRTFDAEELSDVFPSPRASMERINTGQPPPPPTPSSELPQGATRHLTFVRHPTQSRNLHRDNTLLPRSSASPMRSPRPPAATVNELHHKLSAPDIMIMKTSDSGSNILPTNMSDAMALMREQEMKLRASSGRTGEINISLTSSIDSSGGGRGRSTDRLNKSLQGEGGSLSRIFEQRGIKDVPPRYDSGSKRAVGTDLSRNKSLSQSSLKDMASLTEMIRAQAESLRASGEQVMQKVRSRDSLTRSAENSLKGSGSSIGSEVASPRPPPAAEPSQNEPLRHQSIERPTELRDSGATYDLNATRASFSSSIQSGDVALPRKSTSPVTMRRPSRGSKSNIPPPLTLPVDMEAVTPDTPSTAKTARPGSYLEQLHSAKHASSAVEAWVADTMTTMNSEAMDINLAASSESFSGLRDSSETYALSEHPQERQSELLRPSGLRAPLSKLVKPPQSPLASNSENVMTNSQRTLIAKTPTTPTRGPSGIIRRGIAPAAISSGGRGGRGISSTRPPTILRSQPPNRTSTTVPGSSARGGARGQASQLRPPTRVKLPSSLPRGRYTRGGGSVPRVTSHNPVPPE